MRLRLTVLASVCVAAVRLAAVTLTIDGEPVGAEEYRLAAETVTPAVLQAAHVRAYDPAAAPAPLQAMIAAATREELVRFRAELRVARGLGLAAPSFAELRAAYRVNPRPVATYGPASVAWPEYVRQYRTRLAVATQAVCAKALAHEPDLRAEYDAHPERWRSPDLVRVGLRPLGAGALPAGAPTEVILGANALEPDDRLPADVRAAAIALVPGEESGPLRWGDARLTVRCLSRSPGPLRPFAEAKGLILSSRAAAAYQRQIRAAMDAISVSP